MLGSSLYYSKSPLWTPKINIEFIESLYIQETLLGLLNHVKRFTIESNIIYVTSTTSRPRRDQVSLRTPIRPHLEPINRS